MSADAVAAEIYGAAGISEVGELGLGDVAAALLGEAAIYYSTGATAVQLHENPWRIAVHHSLSDEEFTMAIAWGLAQWWLRTRTPYGQPSAEAIAAALVIPHGALLDAIERLGKDADSIAAEFVCPVSTARYRIHCTARSVSGTRPRTVGVAS